MKRVIMISVAVVLAVVFSGCCACGAAKACDCANGKSCVCGDKCNCAKEKACVCDKGKSCTCCTDHAKCACKKPGCSCGK